MSQHLFRGSLMFQLKQHSARVCCRVGFGVGGAPSIRSCVPRRILDLRRWRWRGRSWCGGLASGGPSPAAAGGRGGLEQRVQRKPCSAQTMSVCAQPSREAAVAAAVAERRGPRTPPSRERSVPATGACCCCSRCPCRSCCSCCWCSCRCCCSCSTCCCSCCLCCSCCSSCCGRSGDCCCCCRCHCSCRCSCSSSCCCNWRSSSCCWTCSFGIMACRCAHGSTDSVV
mmetsp:Transcript_15846/g.43084  ORF Transcript_15846/g.43084 Transcript_15846/m.43084 type:complete len:227 (-) Transcript_15846:60-740(-)